MIRLRHAAVEYVAGGCVTHFADGTSFGAFPHPELPHYHVIAHRCGYGDDLVAYAREHEICHLLIEEWLYDRPSRILWGLAHGAPLPPHECAYEEIAAQALQRFVRAAERPIIGGVDWDGLRDRARRVLSRAHVEGCCRGEDAAALAARFKAEAGVAEHSKGN